MSQADTSLEREDTLWHYTQESRVGRGGQGTVYKYTHGPTGTIYAVKVMVYDDDHVDQDGNPENLIRMVRESHVSMYLVHAHLLRAKAVFEYPEGFAIIMPYFRRGSLRQNTLSQTEMKEAIRQILEALRHLHERDKIHRDIKPDNVLVRNEKHEPLDLVVADYGLISVDYPVTFCGSRGFIAPEVSRNFDLEKTLAPCYSKAVDIYALGKLLLKVLNVKLPMESVSTRKRFNKAISAPIAAELDKCGQHDIERRSALSTADRMLRFDPEDRPSVNECLRLPWLSRPSDPPQIAQLARTHSNLSMVNPLSNLSVADHDEWWYSNPRAKDVVEKVQEHRHTGGRYDLRGERNIVLHDPIPAPKKYRVQKRPYESLPTPMSTPDRDSKSRKVKSAGALATRKGREAFNIPAKFLSKTGQEARQEPHNISSVDEMDLSK